MNDLRFRPQRPRQNGHYLPPRRASFVDLTPPPLPLLRASWRRLVASVAARAWRVVVDWLVYGGRRW